MDKKISQLTAASTPLLGTESLPLVQSGVTKKATVQDVLGYVVNDSTNSVLKTVYGANDVGLKLDFANQYYKLGTGDISSGFFAIDQVNLQITSGGNIGEELFLIDYGNSTVKIGDYTNTNLEPYITFDQNITTTYQGNDIGLKLDFANQSYKFGSTNNDYGLIVDALNGTIQLGDIAGWYGGGIYFNIDNLNNFLSVQTGGVDVGLKLDFANLEYYLGGVTDQYNVKVSQGTGVDIGDIFGAANGNQINLTNDIIKTQYSSNDIGLKLDFLNNLYIFGDDSSVASGAFSYAEADSANFTFKIKTGAPAVTNIYANNDITKMGDVDVAANGTTFGVDDTAEKLTASANLLSNTAGGTSGQHIKINIGGTDYKIALLNP